MSAAMASIKTNKGPAPGIAALRLRIALIQNDIQGLQTKHVDASTPGNPQYGLWSSREEVGTFVTPKPESFTAVNGWLSPNGLNVTVLLPFRDWIGFEPPIQPSLARMYFSALSFSHL
ncbi:hypothetical protein BJY52DRAFT_957781 [Lactarius psammicola]|nr:hypothetical protein BJY52DRAFT_957781 [Lactarius psammicola]